MSSLPDAPIVRLLRIGTSAPPAATLTWPSICNGLVLMRAPELVILSAAPLAMIVLPVPLIVPVDHTFDGSASVTSPAPANVPAENVNEPYMVELVATESVPPLM